MKPYNQWFACDMDDLIFKHKNNIKIWFYGHTHMASKKKICNIPFVCNPIGYPNENVILDFDLTIEIQ